MLKDKNNVKMDRVHFELMADGRILVTVLWEGDMAMLSRSAIAYQIGDDFDDVIRLFQKGKEISEGEKGGSDD